MTTYILSDKAGLMKPARCEDSLAVGAAMPSDIYCGGIRKALQEKGYRLYFDSPTNQIFVIMKKEILNAMIDLDTDLGTIQIKG